MFLIKEQIANVINIRIGWIWFYVYKMIEMGHLNNKELVQPCQNMI